MPSNTPMTAAELLRLADAMEKLGAELAVAYRTYFLCANLPGTPEPESVTEYKKTAKAYRAARAASPVTLEEALITDFVSAPKDHNGSSSKFCGALQRLEAHGRVLNSRMPLPEPPDTAAPAPGEEGGGQ